MKKLGPLMFLGTGSDVGKSIITAAFCRIFLQDGFHPAPFKAQNMALNSYVTSDGLEIGRAQAVQAEAAGIDCRVEMNPLLLKPVSDKVCQVVLNGKAVGNKSAFEYFGKEGRQELRNIVNGAFDRLAKEFNPVVMEGAGSISEVNLRDVDIVNMPMAIHANANVILVADIDRGGVFASVYGSVMLLTEEERKYVKGIIINKFRGDIKLFESGIKILEDLCKIPVLGVIPYYKDIHIEEEDSVMLQTKNMRALTGKINIAVILLEHLSNFTDFNALERDERVHLYYTANTVEIEKADIILIPGSKNTISDLLYLRESGIAASIINAYVSGTSVFGICGGYQMMGMDIFDPENVESSVSGVPGLGLLPVETILRNEKITRQVEFTFLDTDETCYGYEIHMGETILADNSAPVNKKTDYTFDGCFVNEKCFGTYIHGILDNPSVINYILAPYMEKIEKTVFDYKAFKEEQYDKLAAHVRNHINMDLVYNIMAME